MKVGDLVEIRLAGREWWLVGIITEVPALADVNFVEVCITSGDGHFRGKKLFLRDNVEIISEKKV